MGIYYRDNCVRMMIKEHNDILRYLRNYMVAAGEVLSYPLLRKKEHLDRLIRSAMGMKSEEN